jgi:S-DNA-T family DNA segregation ATPase FtsK/SpoIIIE
MPHRNILLGGVPGAGKSAAMSMVLATAALDPTVKIWLIDGKMVELAEWEDLAEMFAHRPGEANLLLAQLQGYMERRFRELRDLGERNIKPELRLPLHALFVDELSLFTTGGDSKLNKEFTSLLLDILARGRSAGVIVVSATQKPEGSVVSTNLRDLFAYRWALACGTPEASDTILGRGWAGRGYDASTIAIGEPGVGYLRAEDRLPIRHRGFYLNDDDIRALAARARDGRQR